MRKIILNLAVSADGYIEGPNGEYDWCFTDQDYGMTAFLAQIDTILFGRTSYELMLTVDQQYTFPNKQNIVFSRSLKQVESPFILAEQPVEKFIPQLLSQPGKDIWLFGGAAFVTSLLQADLVDEFHLAIHPIFLGAGKMMISGLKERRNLTLINQIVYDSGLLQVIYERSR